MGYYTLQIRKIELSTQHFSNLRSEWTTKIGVESNTNFRDSRRFPLFLIVQTTRGGVDMKCIVTDKNGGHYNWKTVANLQAHIPKKINLN